MRNWQLQKANQNNRQSGFNLIELLVVISIIALIVSAALLLLNSSRRKSRDARRVADIKQLISGLDLYFNQCNSYPRPSSPPITIDDTMALYTGTGNVNGPCGTNAAGPSNQNGGFGTAVPAGVVISAKLRSSPAPGDNGSCTNAYVYNPTNLSGTNVAGGYTLTFCLGDATGGYVAGTNTITR